MHLGLLILRLPNAYVYYNVSNEDNKGIHVKN